MSRVIVALHGQTGAGKDTVANHLCRTHFNAQISLADAVIREVVDAFDVNPTLLRDIGYSSVAMEELSLGRCTNTDFLNWYFKTADGEFENAHLGAGAYALHRSPQWITDTWAIGYRRSQHPTYWTDQLTSILQTFPSDWHIVINGIQFENDVKALKSLSRTEVWEVIRLNNPHYVKGGRSNYYNRLPEVDRVIFNGGTVEQLVGKVNRAAAKLFDEASE